MEFRQYWQPFFGEEALSYDPERRRFRITNDIYEKFKERTKDITTSLPIDNFELYIGDPEIEEKLVLFDRRAIQSFVKDELEDKLEIDNRNIECIYPDNQQRVTLPKRMSQRFNNSDKIVLASSFNGEYLWIEK